MSERKLRRARAREIERRGWGSAPAARAVALLAALAVLAGGCGDDAPDQDAQGTDDPVVTAPSGSEADGGGEGGQPESPRERPDAGGPDADPAREEEGPFAAARKPPANGSDRLSDEDLRRRIAEARERSERFRELIERAREEGDAEALRKLAERIRERAERSDGELAERIRERRGGDPDR